MTTAWTQRQADTLFLFFARSRRSLGTSTSHQYAKTPPVLPRTASVVPRGGGCASKALEVAAAVAASMSAGSSNTDIRRPRPSQRRVSRGESSNMNREERCVGANAPVMFSMSARTTPLRTTPSRAMPLRWCSLEQRPRRNQPQFPF